jgi:4-hydroxy-tetrahydrodipicolinate synthase
MPNPAHRTSFHPSVPTVMHDDGTLDDDGQAVLAAALAEAGSAGLVALELVGGEAGALTDGERAGVLRAVRRGAGGLPVAVGIGVPDAAMVARARQAAAGGADALVAAVPRGGADQRADLLGQLAALGLPLWLHHHPAATASSLDPDELTALAGHLDAHAVIVEAAPSQEGIAVVSSTCPTYGGLGGLFLLEELEAGASGTVAGSAVPEHLGPVVASFLDAPGEARERFAEVLTYLRLEAGSPGLRVRKEAWRQRGTIGSGRTRSGSSLEAVTKRSITRRLREIGVPLRDPYPGA